MKINKILEVILLSFILCIALLPRSIEVLNKNYIFGFDQGRDYLAVKSIVVDHKPTLIGSEVGAGAAGLSGIFQGPLYYYSLSIPFLLTKGDPYSGVVLMFLISSLSVVFSYIFGKKALGTIGGLSTALLFALSPMFIAQARFTWNSNPSTLFILLAFYFTYLGMKKKNKYIFLSSFFAGFVYNFQFAVSIPLSISIFLYYIFIIKLKEIKKYLILFSGFIFAFLPMLLFELRHGFMGIGGFTKYLFGPKEAGASFLPSQRIVIDHISSFFNAFMDVFPKNIMPPQILLLIVLVPAIYFLYKEKNVELRKFVTFLFLLFPVYFLVFLFFRNTIWVYYLIALNVTYILLFSYSVASSFKKNNYPLKIFYILFLLLVVIKTLPALTNVFIYDYQDYGGTAKIMGKTDAIDFIYNDAKGEKFSLFVFSPPIYVYPYDYILWWHAREKFGYMPGNVKTGTFYLLIEKDNDELWYKGWLETVIKDGTVIWEKTLSSGFIVQKRIVQ
ncbi:MAG: glycosyltransferase family 39 protein [Candidatus Levybacteria bacterium]|nr:glycosyltransferase family 39 protein [Candidatus Levybacteria bacterium]